MVEIALQQVALRRETPQRVELQTPHVDHAAVGRRTPVAALAQRDGTFGREVETLALAHVVFAEDTEVAVEVELAVDDAAVDELQGARRVDARTVGLDLGLAEADVPAGVGHVVDDGVAHDVHVSVGQHLGVVGRESQLDRVDQLGRVDVAVEAQPQPLDARLGLREREVAVERQPDHVLHAEAERHLEEVVARAERDAAPDLDVGHVAQTREQLGVVCERIGREDRLCEQGAFCVPVGVLGRGRRGAAEQQQEEKVFHCRIVECVQKYEFYGVFHPLAAKFERESVGNLKRGGCLWTKKCFGRADAVGSYCFFS